MTDFFLQKRAKALTAVLADACAAVEQLRPCHWACTLPSGEALVIRLALPWLCVSGTVVAVTSATDVLSRNLALPPLRKCIGRGGASVRAELPVVDDWPDRIRYLLADWHGHAGMAAQSNPTVAGLGDLCAVAQWGYSERKNALAVALECETGHCAIVSCEVGQVRVTLDLCSLDDGTTTVRDALADFLAQAQARLRMVRAWLCHTGATFQAGFEIRFPGLPGATELDRALCALSLACQLCAREAGILLDENAAEAFLCVGGRAA